LFDAGTEVRLARRGVLFRDGDPALHLYMIETGAMEAHVASGNDARRTVDLLYPGDVVGLAEDGRFPYTAEAVTGCVLRCIPTSESHGHGGEPSRSRAALLKLYARQLASMRGLAVMLRHKSASARVAALLIRLSRHKIRPSHRGPEAWVPFVLSDVAAYLGMTPETLCRTVAEFQAKGLIGRRDHGFLPLLDMTGMEAVANGR